ncbi:hypothetical protein BC936DRAFT_148344 [Jimgerdemannia flammicorona]|uniref:Uncharacterized protein n=1 Tax=Jimgerdemannia flammicorona TaxID=994334 RepID=A0A433D391_9FUNG|nr:hypothetical protein BC936DRAFT_148344 [Jimgerdemannia flammicorona]
MNILRAVPRRLALSDSFFPRLFHTTHRSLKNRRQLHEEGPDAEDGHQKSRPTAVMNQTFPEVAPTSDTIVPASMFSAFRNMFEQHPAVGIDVVTQDGFVLTDNVQTRGPLVVLNGEAFLWDVQQGKAGSADAGPFEGWDVDVLKVFEVVDPKPGSCAVGK